jgi:hypothetical protein
MKRLKIFGISTILLIALLNSPQLSSADDAWIGESGECWAIPDDREL